MITSNIEILDLAPVDQWPLQEVEDEVVDVYVAEDEAILAFQYEG